MMGIGERTPLALIPEHLRKGGHAWGKWPGLGARGGSLLFEGEGWSEETEAFEGGRGCKSQ